MTTKPNRWRSRFGALLASRRKLRGFKTAYAFFHERGGKKTFGFTFQQYVRVEKGLRLPSELGLERILDELFGAEALYIKDRKELLVAFLRALVGGSASFEPLFHEIEANAASPVLQSDTLADELLKLASRRDHSDSAMMTAEQWKAVVSGDSTFWVFQWLLRTGLTQSAAELAASLRLKPADADRALLTLANVKLVQRRRDGAWFCPHFETDISTPGGKVGGREAAATVSGLFQRRLAAPESGRYGYGFAVIAVENAEQAFPKFQTLMSDAMWKCYLFQQRLRPIHGALVSVEYRLTEHRE